MDPNLFHLDWDRSLEVLAAIVFLSMFIERALSVVFETRAFITATGGKGVPIKEIIAFGVALAVCVRWQFDAVSMTILSEQTSHVGEVITAGIIAGGSKGSVALFRDWFGWKSTAQKEKAAGQKDSTIAQQAMSRGKSTEVEEFLRSSKHDNG